LGAITPNNNLLTANPIITFGQIEYKKGYFIDNGNNKTEVLSILRTGILPLLLVNSRFKKRV